MWRTGLVALRHAGSSRTRARTRVPANPLHWQAILKHCATREARRFFFKGARIDLCFEAIGNPLPPISFIILFFYITLLRIRKGL